MAVYLNDRFLKNEEALLHVSDLSMQRGYAVFDFFRTREYVPLFMPDHLDRFFQSASASHLPVDKSRDELAGIVLELISRSGIPEAGIRIMLTGGYSPDSYQPARPNLLITCNPVQTASEKDFETGIRIMTYEHRRELPHIKTINYQTAVWLQPLLKEKQVQDVLYFKDNCLTEFPRSNVFMVTREKTLVTPRHHVLKGITRKKILALASGRMTVEERDIVPDELQHAEEVFLTSTTKKVLPVIKINDLPVGHGKPGTITTLLYQQFLDLEKSTTLLQNR